ncbi:MAG: 30S ribosomal protein S12 methylthiotransferase RimO [Candidatus Cloacimonadaceae bacterium]
MRKRFLLISLGCPKNLVDSETFNYIAAKHGYEQADDFCNLDFVLINTCSFIQDAINELERVLRTVVKYKSQGKVLRIFVTGCIMQRQLDVMQKQFPQVDAWIPMADYKTFEKLITQNSLPEYHRLALTEGPYTYLKISDGCNNRCSYCTIPSIKGNLHSADINDLVDEAKQMAKQGAVELIVIAQDTSAYGIDIDGQKHLPELLERLHEIKEYHWLRLMYLHPRHTDKKLVQTIAKLSKIVHAFEIPLQHCNDDILKKMNRNYRKKDIINTLQMFKEAMPDAEFRTTFMTGFPGETRKEFNELMQFVQDNRFLRMGVFAFSPEEGTPAYDWENRVSRQTALKRKQELLSLHRELSAQYLAEYVGKEIEVLVEEGDTEEQTYLGRAWFDAPEIDGVVNFQGQGCNYGDLVQVQIDDVIDIDLFGSFRKVVSHNRKTD